MDWHWAEMAIQIGEKVRRPHWPIEIEDGSLVVWHVYTSSDRSGYYQGWYSGVIGADNEVLEGYGMSSGIYMPSAEDLAATDWTTPEKMSLAEIMYLDSHRTPRVIRPPNPVIPAPTDKYVYVIYGVMIAIVLILITLWW